MRLINADALKYHKVFKEDWLGNKGKYANAIFEDEVEAQPTVDAVPVIWCKDCKWNKSEGDWVECPMSGMYGRKAFDNYCSLAERKEE